MITKAIAEGAILGSSCYGKGCARNFFLRRTLNYQLSGFIWLLSVAWSVYAIVYGGRSARDAELYCSIWSFILAAVALTVYLVIHRQRVFAPQYEGLTLGLHAAWCINLFVLGCFYYDVYKEYSGSRHALRYFFLFAFILGGLHVLTMFKRGVLVHRVYEGVKTLCQTYDSPRAGVPPKTPIRPFLYTSHLDHFTHSASFVSIMTAILVFVGLGVAGPIIELEYVYSTAVSSTTSWEYGFGLALIVYAVFNYAYIVTAILAIITWGDEVFHSLWYAMASPISFVLAGISIQCMAVRSRLSMSVVEASTSHLLFYIFMCVSIVAHIGFTVLLFKWSYEFRPSFSSYHIAWDELYILATIHPHADMTENDINLREAVVTAAPLNKNLTRSAALKVVKYEEQAATAEEYAKFQKDSKYYQVLTTSLERNAAGVLFLPPAEEVILFRYRQKYDISESDHMRLLDAALHGAVPVFSSGLVDDTTYAPTAEGLAVTFSTSDCPLHLLEGAKVSQPKGPELRVLTDASVVAETSLTSSSPVGSLRLIAGGRRASVARASMVQVTSPLSALGDGVTEKPLSELMQGMGLVRRIEVNTTYSRCISQTIAAALRKVHAEAIKAQEYAISTGAPLSGLALLYRFSELAISPEDAKRIYRDLLAMALCEDAIFPSTSSMLESLQTIAGISQPMRIKLIEVMGYEHPVTLYEQKCELGAKRADELIEREIQLRKEQRMEAKLEAKAKKQVQNATEAGNVRILLDDDDEETKHVNPDHALESKDNDDDDEDHSGVDIAYGLSHRSVTSTTLTEPHYWRETHTFSEVTEDVPDDDVKDVSQGQQRLPRVTVMALPDEGPLTSLVGLSQQHPMYAEVAKLFNASCGDTHEIVSIDYLANTFLWRRYSFILNSVAARAARAQGRKTVELLPGQLDEVEAAKLARERRLWYGVSSEYLLQTLATGPRFEYNPHKHLGRGIYTHLRPDTAAEVDYSSVDEAGDQIIALCRVVLGTSTTPKEGAEIAFNPAYQGVRYDSTSNASQTIFAVAHDYAVYPEFIVKFKTKLDFNEEEIL